MKGIALTLLSLTLACSSAGVASNTPNCDSVFGRDWAMNLGHEEESSSNLDSNKCVSIDVTWCCAL